MVACALQVTLGVHRQVTAAEATWAGLLLLATAECITIATMPWVVSVPAPPCMLGLHRISGTACRRPTGTLQECTEQGAACKCVLPWLD